MNRILSTLTALTLTALLAATAGAKPAATADAPKKKDAAADAINDEIRKADSKTADADRNKAITITVKGTIRERGSVSLFTKKSDSLKDYLDAMRKVREDRDIKTVVLRVSDASLGLATAQELRLAVTELRDKGKKVIAVLETDSQPGYLLACAADEVVIPPSGSLMLYGVKADAYFLRSVLAKVGVTASVVHIGRYKSAGEPLTEDTYTTPARENMTEIVDDMYSQMLSTIAASRKIRREDVEAAVNRGPMGAGDAVAARFVDRIAYSSDVQETLRRAGAALVDGDDYTKDGADKLEDISPLSLILGMNRSAATSDKASKFPQVAVVYAVGQIVSGSSDSVLGGEDEIAAEDFIKTLDEVEKDKKVKAVILRVNSPGGSAFASDLIWKKVEDLKKTKPVVASMGDVAASGGYYIAMGANRLIAQPGTLTGSIGVLGGKLNMAGGFDKVGLKKETISRGKFASLFSETSGFSEAERAVIERMMRQTYDDFTSKAAAGRRLPVDELRKLAEGKVWSGERAKTVKLVDDLGGMTRAIEETKLLLGMKKDEKVALVPYPREKGLMDVLRKALGGSVTAQVSLDPAMALLPPPVQAVLDTARGFVRILARERVLAVMPFVPAIQ